MAAICPRDAGPTNLFAAMAQGIRAEAYLERSPICAWVCPDISLSTDIVGYPGETEADFDLRRCHSAGSGNTILIYSFAYSSPRNTWAVELPDDVPAEEKSVAWTALQSLQKQITGKRLQRLVGRTGRDPDRRPHAPIRVGKQWDAPVAIRTVNVELPEGQSGDALTGTRFRSSSPAKVHTLFRGTLDMAV